MYRPLMNYFDQEVGSSIPFSLRGVINGKVKAFFDGQQYVVNEEEYKLKKKIFKS